MPEPGTALPRTAAVIPVRGHSDLLRGCLDSLRAQEVPLDEIVVVDDSPDGSLEDLPGVTLLRSGGRGPYVARNLGWRHTRADVVMFCDARSRPRPAWSRMLAEQFQDTGVVLAGSEVLVVGGTTPASAAAARTQTFRLENYVARSFFRPYLPTCNLAVRRSALEAVEGFADVRSGGDADLCWRILEETGGRLATVGDVLADWIPRDRARDYLEQHYRYGRSNYQLRVRWSSEGLDVPGHRPLWRIGVRAAAGVVRLGAAVVTCDIGRRATALVKAAQAANEAGYAAAHARDPEPRQVLLTNALRDRTNPWLSLWLKAEGVAGIKVEQLSRRGLLCTGRDRPMGIHLQWPEHALAPQSSPRAGWYATRLVVQVGLGRMRRLPVLLTMHNLGSHEQRHRLLEKMFWAALTRLVTDIHLLSAASRPEVIGAHPALAGRPVHVIPHGTYESVIDEMPSRHEARTALGLPSDGKVILSFGALKPYKGVSELVAAFAGQPEGDGRSPVVLVLAGSLPSVREQEDLRGMVTGHDNIFLYLGYLSQEHLVECIRACDVVVLPYRKVLNSGSLFMALTCRRRVLVPDTAVFEEIKDDLSGGWISTFAGRISFKNIQATLDSAEPGASTNNSEASKFFVENSAEAISHGIETMWSGIKERTRR